MDNIVLAQAVTISLGWIITVITTLAGVVATLSVVIRFLWKANETLHKSNLEMTIKFIDSTNENTAAIERLERTIETNAKTTRNAIENLTRTLRETTDTILTVKDLWKGIEFLKKKGE